VTPETNNTNQINKIVYQSVPKDSTHRYERVSARIAQIGVTVKNYEGLKLVDLNDN
jgi:hypothetical protein